MKRLIALAGLFFSQYQPPTRHRNDVVSAGLNNRLCDGYGVESDAGGDVLVVACIRLAKGMEAFLQPVSSDRCGFRINKVALMTGGCCRRRFTIIFEGA